MAQHRMSDGWQEEGLLIYSRRIILSILFGIISGLLYLFGWKLCLQFETSQVICSYILLNGALIGFVIGISTFRIHWILHGILIGFIMGIPFALGFLVVILWTIGLLEYLGLIGSEGISIGKLIAIPLMGALSGFLIEFFTSFVFKAGVRRLT